MSFHKWLSEALAYANRHPEFPIGRMLVSSLRWNNEAVLKRVDFNESVSSVSNPYSPFLWDFIEAVRKAW